MSSKHLDDDDVDELDDVLEKFNDDSTEQNPSWVGSSRRLRHNTTVDPPPISLSQRTAASNSTGLSAGFAQELAQQMEEYLLQAFNSTDLSASPSDATPSGDRNEEGPEKSKVGEPSQPTHYTSISPSPSSTDNDDFDYIGDDTEFAQTFKVEMENFMREIGIDPSSLPSNGMSDEEKGPEKEGEADEAFKRIWEAINTSGDSEQGPQMDGTKAGPSGIGSSTSQGPAKGKGFQDVLRPVIDKMKESEESNTQKGPSLGEGLAPENLEELIASLSSLESGSGKEEELSGFLENMMKQLLSKEVLYEPLKELSDKFPGYLASPPSPIGLADRERYEKQLAVINKIIAVFDAPDFRDDNPETHGSLVELMSEVQSYGSPPEELMGPLPAGLGSGSDGCVIT